MAPTEGEAAGRRPDRLSGTSLHHVAPVTRGARLASFFWTQSLVRLDWHRTMLFELDQTIQRLGAPGR